MMIRSRQNNPATRRSGYTLIEMLISVSLVAVLMLAVWGLMSMYTTLQSSGAEATAEQQLVRSVLQLIRRDLSSVPLPAAEEGQKNRDPFAAFDPVDSFSSLGPDRFRSESNQIVFDIQDLHQNPDAGPANFTFVGTSDTIKLTMPRPAAPPPPASEIDMLNQLGGGSAGVGDGLPEGIAPAVEEFQTVLYQFQSFGSTEDGELPFGLYRLQVQTGHLQALLNRRRRVEQEAVEESLRVNREVLEELLFPPPDDQQQSVQQTVTPPVCDLIPEVVDCRFEYRHGDRWHTRWKSDRAGTLPDAVRISLDVVSANQRDELRAAFVTEGPPGQLEQLLSRSFTRPETPTRRPQRETTFEELKIVPHQYRSIVLLNTTATVRPRSLSDDGGFALCTDTCERLLRRLDAAWY